MSISNSFRSQLKVRFGDRVRFDEPLAPYVAYAVGGPADALVFPRTETELTFLSQLARENRISLTIIGRGTNLLVCDGGIRGITLSLLHSFRETEIIEKKENGIVVRCGGGVLKSELLDWAVDRGYGGLEFSAGVPGTIGGGIFMNAGTKYGCYGDILRRIRLFDFDSGATEFKTSAEQFGYREQKLVKDTLVMWADFELIDASTEALRAEVARIIAERTEKQPLDYPSCGSTFKNPEGHSSGRLIERAGLKGLKVGGAEISNKHANFILNKGNARASDILELIAIAKAKVKENFGIDLECEVIILGESEERNP
jgi:UDP-N-acetylmuramate dehydrogenase